jgi:hypothetical protein
MSLEDQLLALHNTLCHVEDVQESEIQKQFKGEAGQGGGKKKENVFKSTQELLQFLEEETSSDEEEEEASTSKKCGESQKGKS